MQKTLKPCVIRWSTWILWALGGPLWAYEYHIAVIIPMEHQAMEDILSGIRETLSPDDYHISTYHAHGDLNILSNTLHQISYHKVDAVIAIGTTTSQMALSALSPDVPIICTATSLVPPRDKAYTVDDTVDVSQFLTTLPHLKTIGVCYSTSDKNIIEIQALKKHLQGTSLALEERMVHVMQDIPTAVASFSSKVQALLVLKDHMTVSALPIFLQECTARHIPLIASDASSVQQGATMALGVEEKQIGIVAAQVLQNHFSGQTQPPVVSLSPLAKIYLNTTAFQNQNLWTQKEILQMPWPVIEEHPI